MNIKAIFPFLLMVFSICFLLLSNRQVKETLKVPINKVSGEDLYLEYIVNPMDVYSKNIPILLEKLHRENFDFLAFKEQIQIKNPVRLKKILLRQEFHLKMSLNSDLLNVLMTKNYRISNNSLNERVLDILSRI
tara:strand:+ start:1477 stop:1878 length:402 start_codon:yes stop_codon:yes gene_type:complete